MSSKINSKDIINKQKEKYNDSKWSKFLTQEFDKPEFEKLLDQLIAGVSQGNTFTPPMKSWFNDFNTMDPDNLKVVIISQDSEYIPHLPNMINYNLEELNKQGVMFYNLGRTKVGEDIQLDEWRMFNIYFLDYLLSTRKDIVYVFIGYKAEEFAEIINTDEHGYKIFLPPSDHPVWTNGSLNTMFKNNINMMLENLKHEPINW